MNSELLTVNTISAGISANEEVAKYHLQVVAFVSKVKALAPVTTPETRGELYAELSAINKLSKAIDERRKAIIAPARADIDNFNSLVETKLLNPIKDLISTRKPEIAAYDAEVEAKKQAELKRLREEAETKAEEERQRLAKLEADRQAEAAKLIAEARKKADEEAKKNKLTGIDARMAKKKADEAAQAIIDAKIKADAEEESRRQIAASVEQAKLRNQTEDLEAQKSKGGRKIWTYEVTDIDQVPTGLLMIDTKAVTEAIRRGDREIPGLRIFQKDVTAL